ARASPSSAPPSARRKAWPWPSTRPSGPKWSARSPAMTPSSSPPVAPVRRPSLPSVCVRSSESSPMPNTVNPKGDKPIVLAYTGGIDEQAARTLAERSKALGAVEHHIVDARADYFEQVLRFLIMGNVKRGNMYPLCVGAERVMQAQTIARMARELGTERIAHGCTAA